jgi:hypothetical protein
MQFESLSNLEEDLDRLLKIGEEGATASREAPIFGKYSDLDDDSELFSDCVSSRNGQQLNLLKVCKVRRDRRWPST